MVRVILALVAAAATGTIAGAAALAAGPTTQPATATTQPAAALPAREHVRVFLLIGQSNMAGRGKVEEQDLKAHRRVVTLTKENTWTAAVDPLHFDKRSAGVGLGTTFGKVLAEKYPNDTIALVPAAVGGTSIDQWAKGGALYDEAVKRAKRATSDGRLAGILWHQGESGSDPRTYAPKAEKLFADLRADLGSPDVPIVLGTLGDFFGPSKAINPVLLKLAQSVRRCACADASGLKDKGDKLHFSAESYRELGKRYAEQWFKIVQEDGGGK
jgi:hypothetical protein